jgi:hypothetical protein
MNIDFACEYMMFFYAFILPVLMVAKFARTLLGGRQAAEQRPRRTTSRGAPRSGRPHRYAPA